MTPGQRFREALINNKPLQIVGCVNAYCALMADKVGHKSVYLSGAGVSNASFGMPDLGMTSLNDVIEDAKRITSITELPLLVDIDTGWGGAFNISRTIKEMYRSGVASIHIEDQVGQKRCGHRPNKEMVSTEEMVDRVKACVDARQDESFFIIARTDAFASEGMESSINRAKSYIEAGADGIFAEVTEGLADTQRDKLAGLAENVEFESEADYREKLVTLRDSYFPENAGTQRDKSENLSEEANQPSYQEVSV